jgi:hypothetical protein
LLMVRDEICCDQASHQVKVQEKGKGMNGGKYVRMILNGPLKQAAKQVRTARWWDILVVEDGAHCHCCKLARQARTK